MSDMSSFSRSGEYLVAQVLEACGIRVVRVDLSGHDLWCRTPSNRLMSVQVKASHRPRLDVCRYEFYDRSGTLKPDVYGFVALDLGLVLFEAGMGKRKNIRSSAFTDGAMRGSIARFFY